jgi:cellulose synthase/poly-beta-1,6-N-acetylglucosamine synthase-like glycosyltransferase
MNRDVVLAAIVALALAPLALLWILPLVSELLMLARIPGRRRAALAGSGSPVRFLILVAAHNESLTIAECVTSLLALRREKSTSDVVVIADNCGDDTAEVARRAGARVLERADLARRGKPHALDWAMNQLPVAEYDAVVIIDADTVVDPGFADAAATTGGPGLREFAMQSYLDTWNAGESWLGVLGELLAAVRYASQYELKDRAGINVPLTGNGMVLGTAMLARAGWVQESLTENWEVYARYTERGERIKLARGARVFAQEAKTMAQGSVQRRRWQAGRWIVFRDHLKPILTSRAIGWRQKLDTLGELAAPGPVVQAAGAVALGLVLMLLPGILPRIVAIALLLSLIPTVLHTAICWIRSPRRGRIAVAFLRLPIYVVWRMTLVALAFRTGRAGVWQRSPRHRPNEG